MLNDIIFPMRDGSGWPRPACRITDLWPIDRLSRLTGHRRRGMFDLPQPALPPDRSHDQDDDHAQYGANEFAPIAAVRKARRHAGHRQDSVKLDADRAGEESLQFRMNRGIGGNDVAG